MYRPASPPTTRLLPILVILLFLGTTLHQPIYGEGQPEEAQQAIEAAQSAINDAFVHVLHADLAGAPGGVKPSYSRPLPGPRRSQRLQLPECHTLRPEGSGCRRSGGRGGPEQNNRRPAKPNGPANFSRRRCSGSCCRRLPDTKPLEGLPKTADPGTPQDGNPAPRPTGGRG